MTEKVQVAARRYYPGVELGRGRHLPGWSTEQVLRLSRKSFKKVVEEEWRAATQSLKRRGVVILFTPGSKHSCKPIISPASQFSFIEGYFLLQST